jgi:3-deoxy-D-manno-octulosonic-acid transferase
LKFIIAPHNIKKNQIEQFKNNITKKSNIVLRKAGENLADFDVFIIDTIGILTKYIVTEHRFCGWWNPGVHNFRTRFP